MLASLPSMQSGAAPNLTSGQSAFGLLGCGRSLSTGVSGGALASSASSAHTFASTASSGSATAFPGGASFPAQSQLQGQGLAGSSDSLQQQPTTFAAAATSQKRDPAKVWFHCNDTCFGLQCCWEAKGSDESKAVSALNQHKSDVKNVWNCVNGSDFNYNKMACHKSMFAGQPFEFLTMAEPPPVTRLQKGSPPNRVEHEGEAYCAKFMKPAWDVMSTRFSGCRRPYGPDPEGNGACCNHKNQLECRRSITCKCGLSVLPLTADELRAEGASDAALQEPDSVLEARQKKLEDFPSIEEYAVAVQDYRWWCSPCT